MISLIKLIINLILGVIIIFVPNIITGHSYDINNNMGSLLVSEFIMRVITFVIGLLVISFSIKNYSK